MPGCKEMRKFKDYKNAQAKTCVVFACSAPSKFFFRGKKLLINPGSSLRFDAIVQFADINAHNKCKKKWEKSEKKCLKSSGTCAIFNRGFNGFTLIFFAALSRKDTKFKVLTNGERSDNKSEIFL